MQGTHRRKEYDPYPARDFKNCAFFDFLFDWRTASAVSLMRDLSKQHRKLLMFFGLCFETTIYERKTGVQYGSQESF